MRFKKIILTVLFFLTISIFISPIHADMGPKPSVTIQIHGVAEDEVYYGAFLAEEDEILHAMYSDNYTSEHEDYEIYLKFSEYTKVNNFNFHDSLWKLQGNNEFAWYYYAPSHFRILLYFPSSDTFLLSEEYTRYTFKAHYDIYLEGKEISTMDTITLECDKYSLFAWELISFLIRMTFTILIELHVAKACELTSRKERLTIIALNILTQIYLNTTLAIQYINSGPFLFFVTYFLAEFKVFLIETFAYILLIPRISLHPIRKRTILWYTVFANFWSFLIGVIISLIIPGIY